MERIARRIFLVRDHKVMFDADLAALYGVPTKVLNQAVRRNLDRFPEDFMFQLTEDESETLRSQFVTSNEVSEGPFFNASKASGRLRSQSVTSKTDARGGRRYRPFVFTEHGVAMLSSVLSSDRAVQVNILIVRAFVRLRKVLSLSSDLGDRLADLEEKYAHHDENLKVVFETLHQLLQPEPTPPRRRIGYRVDSD
ncbi:MAG: ORF6N domain-containing protein [Bryobacteraceae bacterium]|nr:ORF6N domain-containing protein [Bryobacteraceae bacterium]